MKYLKTFLLVVTLIGSSLVQVECGSLGLNKSSDSSLDSPNGGCAPTSASMYMEVYITGFECLQSGSTPVEANKLSIARTAEDLQQVHNGYCLRKSLISECLVKKTNDFEVCRNQTYVQLFKIYSKVIERILDIECARDGERFTTFFQGILVFQSNNTAFEQIRPCIYRAFSFLMDGVESYNVDFSSKVFLFHKELQQFRKCIFQSVLDQPLREVFDFYLGEMDSTMKCIDPQDGTLVTCADIEANSISSPSVCNVKTNNNEVTIYDAMENEAGKCFSSLIDYDVFINTYSTSDKRDISEQYKERCEVRTWRQWRFECVANDMAITYFNNCMTEVKEKKEFEILKSFIKKAIEIVCMDNGKQFSDIMLEVFRQTKLSNMEDDAVLGCIRVAKAARHQNVTGLNLSKNIRFYHDLVTFKGCFLNKLQGDQTSFDAATSLIGEMLGITQCESPDDGSMVLCDTIVNQV